jgi:uncharacterized FlaG/YvyC family protein
MSPGDTPSISLTPVHGYQSGSLDKLHDSASRNRQKRSIEVDEKHRLSQRDVEAIALELQKSVDQGSMRFIVKNVSKVEPNNVIIEIVDSEGHVIRQIPDPRLQRLHERLKREGSLPSTQSLLVDESV